MLYIDDRLPTHPKIFKAGARLPENGAAQVLAVYLAGLAYAREHLTDGFLPAGFINSLVVFSQTPQDVVNALISRGVQLWHKVPGGYRIHDYLDWNEKASQVKEKRAKWRAKKKAQRRKGSGHFSAVSLGDTPREEYRDSRAPVPRSKYRAVPTSHDREVRADRSFGVLTGADAPGFTHPVENRSERHVQDPDVPCPLRDGARGVRSCDRQLRMDRADQGAPGRARVGLSAAARSRGRDDGDRARAREEGHRASAAAPAALAGAAAGEPATVTPDVSACVDRGIVHVDRGHREGHRGAA